LGAAETFGGRAQAWLGEEATEERVRAMGPEAGVLHLACHGFVDPEAPLESGLALSRPRAGGGATEDGLLQAWEILEDLRLGADLVVLSACQTALGREIAGEGVIGLTRAFQLAGARSVVASLWAVSDESTARLMQRFYRHRADGKEKDEALRLAQLDLVRSGGPDGEAASHPFFWAPFELFGDFR
jgi:CHAT domain-containing protein